MSCFNFTWCSLVLLLKLMSLIKTTMPVWNSFNAFVVGRSALSIGGASTVGNP